VSIVATKVTDDKIELVADSQITLGMTADVKDQFAKITVSPLGVVIGGVGYAETLAMFGLYSETHAPRGVNEYDLFTYYHEFSKWSSENGVEIEHDVNMFHLLYAGYAFRIHGYYIKEIETFDAIGSGADYALAVLHLGHEVEDAVKVACDLNIFCGYPITRVAMNRGDDDDVQVDELEDVDLLDPIGTAEPVK